MTPKLGVRETGSRPLTKLLMAVVGDKVSGFDAYRDGT